MIFQLIISTTHRNGVFLIIPTGDWWLVSAAKVSPERASHPTTNLFPMEEDKVWVVGWCARLGTPERASHPTTNPSGDSSRPFLAERPATDQPPQGLGDPPRPNLQERPVTNHPPNVSRLLVGPTKKYFLERNGQPTNPAREDRRAPGLGALRVGGPTPGGDAPGEGPHAETV